MTDPFRDLARALAQEADAESGNAVRIDSGRMDRTGIPEFIFGEGKQPDQITEAILRLLTTQDRALVSRIDPETAEFVVGQLPEATCTYDQTAQVLIVARPGAVPTDSGGRVGVICAGTSDLRYAREAQLVAEIMGCRTQLVIDVGVAGLHRLVQPLRKLMEWNPDALITVAGMDGALPSVVAGLVDVPVIGLPVSTGYGAGGNGTGALQTMLQSCAPGLVVVNIDNGTGAGSSAARMANRIATLRNASQSG